MDSSLYKQLVTKRGLKYNYYISSGDPSKPTLLFIHGFPSTAHDWRHQVAFFKKAGYPIIVPDMLGYGGTDKPLSPALYKHSGIAADIVDVLDAQKVDKAIVVGHDWGSVVTSHLAVYYPDRFLAFAFLAVGYSPSAANFNYEKSLASGKAVLGYETVGYWEFFAEEGAERILRDHAESFLALGHATDPAIWKTRFCPRGALKSWLLADMKVPVASYLSDEDKKIFLNVTADLGGALNYYRIMLDGTAVEDDKQIPESRYALQHPVFFGGTKLDWACQPSLQVGHMHELCANLTVKEWNAGHWVQLEAPDEVNRELLAWIASILNARL